MGILRIPVTTYRLQFSPRFRFKDAQEILAYLDALGITDVYVSPLFMARKGSSHGYDVTDPSRLNPDLGSGEEFDTLAATLNGKGMGLLLDIVPNHMAAGSENRWWMDVLERGVGSAYARFFDIDWLPSKKALERKILLPILGGPYGDVLENRELTLSLDKSGFIVRYSGMKLPVCVKSCNRILSHRIETVEETYGRDSPSFRELWELIASIDRLQDTAAPEPAYTAARTAEEESIKRKLGRLYRNRPEVRSFLEENIRIFNGRKGEPASLELLDRLLSEQHYWLSYWRFGNEEINYRRFFTISDLVGLRVEELEVFNATHDLVLRLAREEKVTGLRVDHIDGLSDPLGYLTTLRDRIAGSAEAGAETAGCFYTVVEKILQGDEDIPPEWPVNGTTGYDFLNAVNGVFISARGVRELDEIYARFIGRKTNFGDLVYRCRKLVMEAHFAGEMHSLGKYLGSIAEQDRRGRDLPRKELRQAMIEVTACFPVYRTYIRGPDISARDRLYIGRAIREARRRGAGISSPVFDFVARILLPEGPSSFSGEHGQDRLRFLMRWQQFTGPIMAKGFEDTALYLYNRLVSANEVGGEPASPAVAPAEFHRRAKAALSRFPHGMNATSSHDTKRSEDVRARIDVLSELPAEWEKRLLLWSRWNSDRKRSVGGRHVPDPSEETLVYQTLLGAWPFEEVEIPSFAERVKDYMVKAVREAKAHTHWDRPNHPHENAVRDFVDAILEGRGESRFFEDFLSFRKKIAWYGALNSLSQVVLKIASPGVPDFYQGTELWDFSLVDPDNRRPVDFSRRSILLGESIDRKNRDPLSFILEILAGWEDGRIKLFLTHSALNFRRLHRELFQAGSYIPLGASAGKKEHVLSFARERNGFWVIAAVPRLMTRLAPPGEFPLGRKTWGAQGGLLLPVESPVRWTDVFTGETMDATQEAGKKLLALDRVFESFPVAILSGSGR
ncbi:MAG: malto-oligosyltrehalose synthase [Deltaproteobacteria bacterium]|nr:malto-oligosyltrehalose synthase [Deltaproteobacteria bacterium]